MSYGTVYGVDNVGGLIGSKNQSMGACSITNSAFCGEVIATGDYGSNMKTRLTALLLALSMMLGLVSCGGQPVGEETSPATS